MTRKIEGYGFLAAAMATVGSTVIASKLIGAGLAPFTATALRFAVALPVFLIILRVTGERLPRLGWRAWGLLTLQAGAGSVGYTTFLISGLRHTSAVDAGVIIGTLPAVTAAIAIVVLGERPRWTVLAAIGLSAAGVALISLDGGGTGGGSLLGNGLILAAVLCEGVFILLNKRLATPIAPLMQSTLMTGLGLLVALGPAAFEVPWTTPATASALLAVVYYALVPTVGGFILWYAGAARVTGAEAAIFTAVAPVTAALLGVAVLGETIAPPQALGIGLVLAAILGMTAPELARGWERVIVAPPAEADGQ